MGMTTSDKTARTRLARGELTFEGLTEFDSLGRRHAHLIDHVSDRVVCVAVTDDNADYWEALPLPDYVID